MTKLTSSLTMSHEETHMRRLLALVLYGTSLFAQQTTTVPASRWMD